MTTRAGIPICRTVAWGWTTIPLRWTEDYEKFVAKLNAEVKPYNMMISHENMHPRGRVTVMRFAADGTGMRYIYDRAGLRDAILAIIETLDMESGHLEQDRDFQK
jgi:hypothetical protein